MNILVLNAGSSSEKISFYTTSSDGGGLKAIWETEADFPAATLDSEGEQWLDWLKSNLTPVLDKKIDAVGHRIVHGGDKYSSAVIIDNVVKTEIKKYSELAPLHNKISLAQIEAIEKLLPNVKQIAVFDTAFHHTLPEIVSLYPVPYEWHKKYGIRKFGFHGINHQYCTQEAAKLLGKDLSQLSLIICHLGSGCSLAAVENGKSVNTTMGFTPLDGLMMSTRSGSLDPGILLYLLKEKKLSVENIEKALNKESGLKGVSQISADMKKIIEEMDKGNKLAKLAFDMFINRLRGFICSMRASLSKLDALVFTAGIGENSELVREKTCAGLEFISYKKVLVIKANEDWAVANECLQVVD